ncbi:MAG: flavodoxin family protein [Deltaproteobacteria bacterium]|jgi:multimeric flavodoxin WrbA|nr:flavodoxin family protein [Deltaproteobacteria bacterium]
MMNILAINGSPRRHWNSELILEHALQGAQSGGEAQGEIAQLYPMRYSGCLGCYACKRKPNQATICQFKDPLTPLLQKAQQADVLLLSTPVYFFRESAGMCAFIERLLYPWTGFFKEGYASKRPKPLTVGLFYTMAGTEQTVPEHGHEHFADSTDVFFSFHFPGYERLMAYETLHTEDYNAVELDVFDPVARRKSREERFIKDCTQARAIGASLAAKARAAQG